MSAALALPLPPIDWSTVAPGDWQYLADLVPWPPLRVVPTPPPARDLPPEQREAIDHAVAAVRGRFKLSPERQWDLRQELALALLESDTTKISNVRSWLLTCARNRLANEARDEANQRELLEEAHDLGTPRGYRKGATWHKPFAPFACKGARVMSCARPEALPDYETALVEAIDLRAARGEGPKRTPTGVQDSIAERAIREKRAAAWKSSEPT